MVKAPSGNLTLDSGTILFDGCKVGLDFPSAADSMGRVFRDHALASHLDLIQNVFLGREIPPSGLPGPFGFVDTKAMRVPARHAHCGACSTPRTLRPGRPST